MTEDLRKRSGKEGDDETVMIKMEETRHWRKTIFCIFHPVRGEARRELGSALRGQVEWKNQFVRKYGLKRCRIRTCHGS